MLEKILDEVDSIDLAMKAKADTTVVLQLEKKLQSLENKLQTNCEVMQKLEKEEADRLSLNCKVEEVVAMLSDKRDEWKDSITNEIVMEKLQSKLNEDELEKEDQEKRRNSVIIFGLQESGSPEAEVRVAEDVDKMQSVMKGIEIQYVMNVKSVKLGKRAETADDKPRPLKVTFGSEEDKLDVLKGAKNLKNKKEGGLDKVFIYPDLTPKQREARKKLVAELKSRQSNGESGLIIVGSKIVKRSTA